MRTCGTYSGYQGGCRCPECVTAMREYKYRRRHQGRPPVTPERRLASQTWRDNAACHGMDPAVFFPIAETRSQQDAAWAKERAVQVCRACPVTSQCLHYALDMDETYGVWGATTPDDRDALRRLRRRRGEVAS